jgi:hypothetical protein
MVSRWKARHAIAGVLVGSALLTLATHFAFPASAQNPPPRRPLTAEQQRLVSEKAQRRAAQGIPPAAQAPTRAQSPTTGEPVRLSNGIVRTTKAELRARWEADRAANERYLALLERDSGREVADRKRQELEDQRRRIEELPDGVVDLAIPAVEVGRHSIIFSQFTYDLGGAQKDPNNVVFHGVGTAWDVQYNLVNWVDKRWRHTGCGATQRVYIWDSSHPFRQRGLAVSLGPARGGTRSDAAASWHVSGTLNGSRRRLSKRRLPDSIRT